jgi:repressor LexA
MIDEKVMYSLSKRQRAILKYIVRYQSRKGYSPSIRDICKGVGLSSSSSVHLHLKTLEDKGYIRRDPTKPRTIEVTIKPEGEPVTASEQPIDSKTRELRLERASKTVELSKETVTGNDVVLVECPLIKGYSQNIELFAPSNIEKVIPLPEFVVGRTDAFLLRMMNDSMIGAGIFEGDLCIVYPDDNFEDGEITVLFASGNVTIKKVFRHLNAYRLEPENRKMNPVFVKEIIVLGKVVGLIRTARNNI